MSGTTLLILKRACALQALVFIYVSLCAHAFLWVSIGVCVCVRACTGVYMRTAEFLRILLCFEQVKS